MRAARIISCLFLLSVLPAVLRAQAPAPAPRIERINVPVVEVRSGPSTSPNFYPTSKLQLGDSVQVVREEAGDWLAIVPPRQDSFSWVDARLVDQSGSYAIVKAPQGAPLLVGSHEINQPPTVTNFTAASGAQLIVIGKPEVAADGTKLLPILPAPSEVRYIPKSAIAASAGQQIVSAQATTVPPSYTQPNVAVSPAGVSNTRPLLQDANAAERRGDFITAADLYERLAKQVVETDHDLYVRCLNYAQFLRNKSNGKVAPTNGSYAQTGNMDGRLIPPAPAAYGQPTAYLASQRPAPSQYCYVPDPCQTVTLRAPATTVAPQPSAVAPQQPQAQAQWYGPGELFTSSQLIDGKPAFLMMTARDQAPLYLTPYPGLDLRPYLYHKVQLYGAAQYRNELRTYHMVVMQVNPVQ